MSELDRIKYDEIEETEEKIGRHDINSFVSTNKDSNSLTPHIAITKKYPVLSAAELTVLFTDLDQRKALVTSLEKKLSIHTSEKEQKKLSQQINKEKLYIKKREHTIALHNYGLVLSNVKKYQNTGMEIEDLIQEANFGLIRAIEKFEISKGFAFSTYAIIWIKQFIGRAINQKARLIYIPEHIHVILSKIRKVVKNPQESTPEAIGNMTNLPAKKIKDALDADQITTLPYTQTSEEGFEIERSDLPTTLSFEENVETKIALEEVLDFINTLPARQQKIVIATHGIRGEILSLTEAAKQVGISRQTANIELKLAMEQISQNFPYLKRQLSA